MHCISTVICIKNWSKEQKVYIMPKSIEYAECKFEHCQKATVNFILSTCKWNVVQIKVD